MEYIYGIVKDEETAEEFITKLIESTGENAALISGTTSVAASQAAAGLQASLRALGLFGVTISDQAKMIIFADAIRDPFHLNIKDASGNYIDHGITFGTSLMLVVRHRLTDEEDPAYGPDTSRSNIIIRKAREIDGVTQISDTYLLDNSVYGAGAALDCFAYCIMPTSYGDVIVKIAGCNENAVDLELAFMGLDINAYAVQGTTIQSDKAHNSDFFLTRGPFGGFLLTRMKKSDVCGLVVFDLSGSPLFIWSDNSHLPFETHNGETVSYVNEPMGQLVGSAESYGMSSDAPRWCPDLTYFRDGIQQAALAPISCPSVGNDITKTSKWLYMAPHAYSSFDASQYIRVGSASKGAVYLCDRSVCALEDSSKFDFTDRMLPDIHNLSVQDYKRPTPDQMMPYHDGFDIYFDSLVDYPEGIKYNLLNEDNDLVTNGTVNADGSLGLRLSASGASYAYCGMPACGYWQDQSVGPRCLFVVFRIKNPNNGWLGGWHRQAILFGQYRNDAYYYEYGVPKGLGISAAKDNGRLYLSWYRYGWVSSPSSQDYCSIASSARGSTDDLTVLFAIGRDDDEYGRVGYFLSGVAGGAVTNYYYNYYAQGTDASDKDWSPYFSICGAKLSATSPPVASAIESWGEKYNVGSNDGALDMDLLFLASGPRLDTGEDVATSIKANARFLNERFNLGITGI